MSLMPIAEVKRLDPHIDLIDVSRLMFTGFLEGIKEGPRLPRKAPPDPLTLAAGTLFLIATVPIGGAAEGIARIYERVKEGQTTWLGK